MAEVLRVDAEVADRGVLLDVTVPAGQTIAVVGANGSGKSTLLQLVDGSLRPSTGIVTWAGRELSGPVGHVPPHRRRFAHVEQRALLFPHLNVLENVMFGPRSRGVGRRAARERSMAELAATDSSALADRRPHELSGGQSQRVAIARALAIDPEVVLLDEPFAALDVSVTPDLRRVLRGRLAGRTALLVTHDLLDVITLADRMVVLEAGRVAAEGPVDEICAVPSTQFLAAFVGVNLLHGTAAGEDALSLDGQVLIGTPAGLEPGTAARAIVAPGAVALHRTPPGGSPRNALRATVLEIESHGAAVMVTVRLGEQSLRAELTASAVSDLELSPGAEVVAVIKATQVQLA